ncbi:conserved hypothetical protein [Vibrio chagasii]|nr:conserved hypothetical protein [Vibrio chagasii]CAH7167892.1 conserved hypothetical protein [Vibrio chagasii]CAH7358799.1 conserved hypothetical protein [Vibrio chagasii]
MSLNIRVIQLKKLKLLKYNPRFQVFLYKLKSVLNFFRGLFSNKVSSSEDFFYIVGCGRSGNTLLRRLLQEKYSIYIPGETYVIPETVAALIKNNGLEWNEIVDISLAKLDYHEEMKHIYDGRINEFAQQAKMWAEKDHALGKLYKELYLWMAREKGVECEFVGDKTPLNTLYLGLIKYMHPNAKFIYIVRDPIDVCYSYVESGLNHDYKSAAMRWKQSVYAWEEFKKSNRASNMYMLKYEDLVHEPERVTTEIGKKFGFPTRNEMVVESGYSRTKYGDVEALRHHSNVLNPPSTKSIGKGRNNIKEYDLKIVKHVLGDSITGQGYEVV